MATVSRFVSLHPYFKVHPGKLDQMKALLPTFLDHTRREEKNLFYDFTFNGDELFCREGYRDAEGLLAHLEGVGGTLAEALTHADLIRIEVHGPADELEKLRVPLKHLSPAWFELEQIG